MRRSFTGRSLILYLVAAALCTFALFPFAWAIVSSLKPLAEVYAFPPSFWVDQPEWDNYRHAVTRLPILRFMANSLFISVASVTGAVLTSSLVGFALAVGSFRGRTIIFWTVVLSLLIPAQVLLVPRFLIFDQLGWINTYKPLIVPAWLGGGAFNVLLFRQFFKKLPQELLLSACLDGATAWQTYRFIAMPMIKPAVAAVALLSFVYHWQEFIDPLIYLSDFTTYPIALGLRMYQSMAGTWANQLMAASVIAMIPVVIVFLICQKYVMRALNV